MSESGNSFTGYENLSFDCLARGHVALFCVTAAGLLWVRSRPWPEPDTDPAAVLSWCGWCGTAVYDADALPHLKIRDETEGS